LPWVSV